MQFYDIYLVYDFSKQWLVWDIGNLYPLDTRLAMLQSRPRMSQFLVLPAYTQHFILKIHITSLISENDHIHRICLNKAPLLNRAPPKNLQRIIEPKGCTQADTVVFAYNFTVFS